MSFGIRVAGGTGAGIKRPLKQAYPNAWLCGAGHENPRYAVRCLAAHCGRKRPA